MEILNKSLDKLKSKKKTRDGDCQFIVLTTYNGLGNKIGTIALSKYMGLEVLVVCHIMFIFILPTIIIIMVTYSYERESSISLST